ncbi:MAG: DUF86 domain-containing protein [Terriglobia bacterium]
MKDDAGRLQDILEAVCRIEKYAARGRDAFVRDELVQTWTIHNLQIIGEAARKVSEAVKARHPEVPWRQIIAMRNILVHDYFTVDPEEVWAAVEGDLPDLGIKIKCILRELGSTP